MSSFKFTIGKKIGTGFSVLILFIIVVFGATFLAVNQGIETFKENDKTSNELIEKITPSKEKIIKLRLLVNESKQLAIQWVNNQSRSDVPDKIRLKNLIDQNIPKTISEIEKLSIHWQDSADIKIFRDVEILIEDLFNYHREIMDYLPDIASYDDLINSFSARFLVSQDGEIPVLAGIIDQKLMVLEKSFETKEAKALVLVRTSSEESKFKFESLKIYWVLGAALIIAAILIAIFTTNTIVKPIRNLREILIYLGKGIFIDKKMKVTNDEIGDMTEAMDNLIHGLKKTTDFAREVGQSNFTYAYKPLSDKDVLGHALLKMRDELAVTERILEQKVAERTEEVVKQRDEIEKQRVKLEELYKDVTDSIVYAKRLQYSILPSQERIKEVLPDSFVLFMPKDIVSGDFYWVNKIDNKSFCATVDCTGHGVPGAFMSLVGANGLNASFEDKNNISPGHVLDELNEQVTNSLHKENENSDIRDGMDMSLVSIDYEALKLEYAGANNPVYIIRNNQIIILKADKFAIASFKKNEKNYTNNEFTLQKNDVIYAFTDGYADQFGGNKGKKFMYKNFRDLLISIHKKPLSQQQNILYNTIKQWQGNLEQIDDILVIGIKI